MKRIAQLSALSLAILTSASLYAQEPPPATAPPAADPAAAPAPVTTTTATPVGPMFIGADVLVALPVGDFSNGSSVGFGALGRYEYVLNAQLNLTGRLGFEYFVPKTVNGFDYKFWTIPILVGAKFTVAPNFYVAGEIGLFNSHFSATVPFLGEISSSETDFGLTVGAGYRLGNIDLRALLQIMDLGNAGSSMSVVASAGYTFWKK